MMLYVTDPRQVPQDIGYMSPAWFLALFGMLHSLQARNNKIKNNVHDRLLFQETIEQSNTKQNINILLSLTPMKIHVLPNTL